MIIIEGKIRAKQRPRVCKNSTYTPSQTVEYENWIRICYQQQSGKHLAGPIRANIYVYYKIPRSYTKKRIQGIIDGIERPTKKPDADNIAKIVLDSLNGIAYDDDSQIVELHVNKYYTQDAERIEFNLISLEA